VQLSTSARSAAIPTGASARRARTRQLRLQWHVLTRNNLQKAAMIYLALLVIVAILAPWVAPHPESITGTPSAEEMLQAPSWSHPFGTDELGRDIFSRVLYGARISLEASVLTIGIALLLGCTLGAIAAGLGGIFDEIIMRITDIFLSFPLMVLAIVIAAFWGGSLSHAIMALAVTWWPFYARLMRGSALSVRERPYVRAARAMGAPKRTIIFRHILPGSMGPVITMASLDLGGVILALAALSFLGVGAQAPTPEWGLMINESRTYFLSAWWYMAFPGLAITLTVLAFNLLGDGLGEVLEPKTRGRA
jgi:peptide/nickel transport system permease protein